MQLKDVLQRKYFSKDETNFSSDETKTSKEPKLFYSLVDQSVINLPVGRALLLLLVILQCKNAANCIFVEPVIGSARRQFSRFISWILSRFVFNHQSENKVNFFIFSLKINLIQKRLCKLISIFFKLCVDMIITCLKHQSNPFKNNNFIFPIACVVLTLCFT